MRVMSLVHDIINDGDTEFLIRKYLRAGVMTSQGYEETRLGTLQGGNLSLLLSNIMLNELDKELEARGLHFTRYLKWNREKSHTVSVFAIRNFKYLGFCYGKNGKEIYVRVHGKSWKKAKDKLRIGCFPKVRVNGLSRFKLQPERYD